MSEKSNNIADSLIELIKSQLIDVNTALPGTIVSYSNGVAKVSPTVKKRFADGDILDYPIIPNVRICWPAFADGQAGVKGPIKPGDKCLLIFSQQAIDDTDDRRMFDLQDAYAIPCNLGDVGSATNNNDLVMFFGAAYIKITESGQVEINAPGGTKINTPSTVNTGKFTSQGLFTYQSGMSGSGGGGGATNIAGDINHSSGSITSLGKKIDGSHVHSGVQPGSGTTNPPN